MASPLVPRPLQQQCADFANDGDWEAAPLLARVGGVRCLSPRRLLAGGVACGGVVLLAALSRAAAGWRRSVPGADGARLRLAEVRDDGGCRDWDVRLAGGSGSVGTPLVYKDGGFHPICVHWFADNHNGAGIVCRQLGYATGTLIRLKDDPDRAPASYGTDAIFVRTCAFNNFSTVQSCEQGDSAYETGDLGVGACQAGTEGVAVEIACSGGGGRGGGGGGGCTDPRPDEEYGLPPGLPEGSHGCTDWDVQLRADDGGATGTPMLFLGGGFHPICARDFARTPYGARTFCRQLGYSDGEAIEMRGRLDRDSFYDEQAVYVGLCQAPGAEKLEACSGGGSLENEGCRAGLGGVALDVSCKGGKSARRISNDGCLAAGGLVAAWGKSQAASSGSQHMATAGHVRSCGDWDARLTDQDAEDVAVRGRPEVFLSGDFRPICVDGHGSDSWATVFCNQLGYSSGAVKSTNESTRAGAVFVGACSAGSTSLSSCGEQAGKACVRGEPLAARVSCWGGSRSRAADAGCDPTLTETTSTTTTTASLLESVLNFERGTGFERLDLTRCALVGCSNVLVGSGSGEQIDAYDAVIRINRMPPGDMASDLGAKTDVFFINHEDALSETVDVLQRDNSTPKRISCRELESCRSAAVVQRGDWRCDPQEMTEYWGQDHSMIACVRGNISSVGWSFESLQGFQPSTGFQAFLAFLPLCQELDLFGFEGLATADGHKEWTGHNLQEEHRIQDLIVAREWSKLPWSRDSTPWAWIQAHAAAARKVVGSAT